MGTKHLILTFLIISFAAYTILIYLQPAATKIEEDSIIVMEGKRIWQEKNCNACHQIYGLGGFLGPDLTNVYGIHGKGHAYISAFIRSGTDVMPSFQLEEREMDALLKYLHHVDVSGKSDPKRFKINYDGTLAD